MTNAHGHPYLPAERALMEQLRSVVQSYPLWPGDTILHELAYECCRRGWIVRDASSHWIPTAAGIDALRAYEEKANA